ncbi:MAG: hypothetical protein JWQ30_2673 [Sediminibacterium sp.]|nr:hypothetical protein [Sediminibacterium sp.]
MGEIIDHFKIRYMQNLLISLRRIVLTGIYVLVIFFVLMLIRSQNKNLVSSETHVMPIQKQAV